MIKITEVKVYPVKNQDREEKDRRLKAYATIVFENCFIVRDLKIILGNDGNLFVSMPSRRSKYGSFKDGIDLFDWILNKSSLEKHVLFKHKLFLSVVLIFPIILL